MTDTPSGQNTPAKTSRMSDRILYALDLALAQEDIVLCDLLVRALEVAMTRNTGGREFVEFRDYPAEIEAALNRLADIKQAKAAQPE